MSELEQERLARVALSRLFEPGEPRVTRWAHERGGRATLAAALQVSDVPLDGVASTADDASARLGQVDAERELAQAAALGIRFVIPGDAEWPRSLDDLAHAPLWNGHGYPPVGLWVRGPLRLDVLQGSIAIVGSREVTTYGLEIARDIAAQVVTEGRVVVSGGALGIDQAAHRGALAARGVTVAFLAGGVDRPYPIANTDLLRHIGQHGLLVSEAPPSSTNYPSRFLARNRLIAAVASGTVVVEAALRSGALHTARWAEQVCRPVMGVPGSVLSAQSQGVHQLIRSGSATLVTSGADVLEVVGDAGQHLVEVPRAPERPRDRLPARARLVLEAVPVARSAPTESIANAAGVSPAEVARTLQTLADNDFVERIGEEWVLGQRARSG